MKSVNICHSQYTIILDNIISQNEYVLFDNDKFKGVYINNKNYLWYTDNGTYLVILNNFEKDLLKLPELKIEVYEEMVSVINKVSQYDYVKLNTIPTRYEVNIRLFDYVTFTNDTGFAISYDIEKLLDIMNLLMIEYDYELSINLANGPKGILKIKSDIGEAYLCPLINQDKINLRRSLIVKEK